MNHLRTLFFYSVVAVAWLLASAQHVHGQLYFERQFGFISFGLYGGALFKNGNVVIGGYMYNGQYAAFLQCDSTGHLLQVGSVKGLSYTNSVMMSFKKIPTPSGKRLVATVSNFISGMPNSDASSVVKLDSLLNIESSLYYHDTVYLKSRCWILTDDKKQLFGVHSFDSIGPQTLTMLQTDLPGTVQWEKRITPATGVSSLVIQAVHDGHGGYFGASDSYLQPYNRNVICYRTDSLFNLLWGKRYFFPDNIRNPLIHATRQGELFLIAGIDDTTYTVGTNNFTYSKSLVVCKLDSATGSIAWAKEIGQGISLFPETIFETSDGNLLVGGQYSHGNEYIVNRIQYDGFVLKMDTQGQVIWSDTISSPNWRHRVDDFDEENNKLLIVVERFDHLNPFPYLIVTDTSAQMGCTLRRSNFINTGSIIVTDSAFIPYIHQPSVLSVTPLTSGWTAQIANESAYCATQTGLAELLPAGDLEVFPNPVNEIFGIRFFAASPSNGVLELYNSLSERIFIKSISCQAGENRMSVPAGEIAPGLYYLRISGAGVRLQKKVVVE